MASDLPTEFDFVVLGTGLPESILAAAFSRIGYKVLHLDRNDHYSDQWASFNLRALERFAEKKERKTEEEKDYGDKIEESETLVRIPTADSLVENIRIKYYIPEHLECMMLVEDMNKLFAPKEDDKNTETAISDDTGNKIAKPDETQKTGETDDCQVGISDSQESTKSVDTPNTITGDNTQNTTTQDSVHNPETIDNTQCTDNATTTDNAGTNDTPETQTNDTQNSTTDGSVTDEKTTKNDQPLPKKKKIWTKGELQDSWRAFNIDLAPKLLYSSGKMVELLISSDVAKYCEFRTVCRVLTQHNQFIEKIPCSRADVFSSKDVSMLDKRKLMKFLEWCAGYHKNPEEYEEYKNQTFLEVLKSRKLSEKLQNIISNAIAMVTKDASTEEGLKKTQVFLQSVGRYGNTPFLFPLYGSGELPQAFCRLCAVFGGIYCLQMTADALIINKDNKCEAIITSEGQRISCKWLIMGSSYSPKQYITTDNQRQLSRCILFTDKSLLHSESQELSLLWVPPSDHNKHPITVLELPQSAMVCPKDLYMVHLTMEGSGDPETDFSPFVSQYLSTDGQTQNDEPSEKPSILWSGYFSQPVYTVNEKTTDVPSNIFILDGPSSDIHMDDPVSQAKEIFKHICPDEDFLPKPPHPDDIIYVDETEATAGEGESWVGEKEEGKDDQKNGTSQKVEQTETESEEKKETSQNNLQETTDDSNLSSDQNNVTANKQEL
ncbi:rab proteins geranylgeranyltransferase component A [Patella vulgata]|uniref:rab proteins geranylgeranyltransferase component A n=1 Tax=Patella vulgata TaxID=6465 RepID=UPI0024A846B2|nr:rab proteins geranylgeranyltransferase component A [Patella vulgata]